MINQSSILGKTLVVGVIVLFLGVGIQPAYADVPIEPDDSELVEISTELYGLKNPTSYTIKLTKEDSDKIDEIFDEINTRLNSSKSIDESITIYDWAILELDKYGLFGEISIEEIKKLVLGPYYDKGQLENINKIFRKYNRFFDNNTNSNCLINGIIHCNPVGGRLNYCPMGISPTLISTFITIFIFKIIPQYPIFIGILSLSLVLLYGIFTGTILLPFITMCVLGIGAYHNFFGDSAAYGWINTQGIKRKINTSGPFFGQFPLYQMISNSPGSIDIFHPGVFGFTGIQIIDFNNLDRGAKLLGYALDVRLGPNRPSDIP